MSTPTEALDTIPPIVVAYRLTMQDVRRFVGSEDLRCWTCQVRAEKLSSALLAGLMFGLAGLCALKLGMRSGLLVLGSALVLLGVFGWLSGLSTRRRACRMARDLGIPCDLRVAVSSRGIAKATGPRLDDPARRFPWSEVISADVAHGLIIFRLRPGEAVLLVPDHAFATGEARLGFANQARRWLEAASRNRI